MKVLFLTPSLKTGGGNRVFIELANKLCGMHEVSVVYPCNSKERHTFPTDPRVRNICVGNYASGKLKKIKNLLHCIFFVNKEYANAKVVISDPIFCILIPLIKGKTRVCRFIQADDYRIYDDGSLLGHGWALKMYKCLCLFGYKYKINYLFNSKFVYDTFCQDARRGNVKLYLVHPAISHAVFKPVEGALSPFHGCSLCLVARKHPWKGLTTFISAYRSMPPKMREKVHSVTLVSHDDLSGFYTEGMSIVKPACDGDIARIYQSSDIFISTSWWEGFGLPPLEAMACGCAVITSKSGGVDEFAVDGENCLMFEPKDEKGLLEKLECLLDDEALRKRLSANGIATAKRFDWDKSATQFMEYLR